MSDNTFCACGCGGAIIQPKNREVRWLYGHSKYNEIKTWQAPTEKLCNGCQLLLPIENFSHKTYTSKTTGEKYDRYRSRCKNCEANKTKIYKKTNPELVALKKKERNARLKNDIRHHVQEKISNWRRNSITISDLTVDYLVDLYHQQNGLCYYSKVEMIFGFVDGKIHHNSISLDKLDPEKGYTQGNVVWCSFLTNSMKQNLKEEEFYEMIKKVIEINGERKTDNK
jgi:hypothetical protein